VKKLLESSPVDIIVKSLPSKEPTDYTGAVGQFTISADLPNSRITTNTQGKFLITVTGKGNFIQFGQPLLNWPKEFDVFNAVVSDELDKNKVPTEGRRKYSFSFAINYAGDYIIPPVSFSFFDPSRGQYKKLSTDSIKFEVKASKGDGSDIVKKQNIRPAKKAWLLFIGILAFLVAVVTILFWKRKRTENIQSLTEKTNYVQRLIDISSRQLTDKQFCFETQKLLSGISRQYHLSHKQKQELQTIHNDCQLVIYSDVGSEGKKEELQKKVGDFLKELES
jgi:hypothetical protein